MKTIFISSFHGLISRVLASGLIDQLIENNIRIVLFVPSQKIDYFKENFKHNNIIIEPVNFIPSRIDRFLTSMAFVLTPSRAMEIKWRCDIKNSTGLLLNRLIKPLPFVRNFLGIVIRFMSQFSTLRKQFSFYFKKYEPELVFSTDIQNPFDVTLLHAGRRYGSKSIGMIRSWDNPTCKGIMRFFPDQLLVANNILLKEVIHFNRYPKNKIRIVGVPHYDIYVKEPRISREEFLKQHGLNNQKKIIFFAPAGDRYIDTDWQMIQLFDQWIKDSVFEYPVQLFVRLPPGDTVQLRDYEPSANIVIYQSGVASSDQEMKHREMSITDVRSLADQLYHADVVISGPSTILVDAAALNRPTILYAINGYELHRPLCRSLERYLEYEHLQNIIATGGIRVSKDSKTLVQYINLYLKNTTIDRSYQKRIVEEQCANMIGFSIQKTIQAIMQLLRI
ncbi:MAG: CDP-glycerol glycerophosphotransferase family protein [Patescibacteria group bacterium]|mgnify:CR=1 FL=1